ncbi:MAG: hypothetical protein KAX40_00840, partial [Herpetosiphon sp.]|nr:hypothetical protein [Herpetosiphon sp.]
LSESVVTGVHKHKKFHAHRPAMMCVIIIRNLVLREVLCKKLGYSFSQPNFSCPRLLNRWRCL